jgi:hypothetical protein
MHITSLYGVVRSKQESKRMGHRAKRFDINDRNFEFQRYALGALPLGTSIYRTRDNS